jgi:hypothetical protein
MNLFRSWLSDEGFSNSIAVILLSNIDYKGLPGERFAKNARKTRIFCCPGRSLFWIDCRTVVNIVFFEQKRQYEVMMFASGGR